jgi:STE24 endopeptidase
VVRAFLLLAAAGACAGLSSGTVSGADETTAAAAAEPAAVAAAQTPELAAPPVLRIPAAAEAGPDFDVERATQAYLSQLTSDQRAKSDAYFEGGYWLQVWTLLYGLGVAWLLLGTRIAARLRNGAESVSRRPWLQLLLFGFAFVLVDAALSLPLAWYTDFLREHQYGMSNQTLGAWLGDEGKGLLISVLFGPLALVVLYAVFRRAPRTWWLWGTGVGMVFLVFVVAVAPVYVAPLFNDYQPVPAGPVRDAVLSMARANGVPADEVYVFDASRQTKRISANVSGLFGTMRVSLNDNLLNRTPPEGVEAVMAHELGHYVLNHTVRHLVSFGLVLLAGAAFVAWAFNRVVARLGQRWDVRGVADPAGLPLLGALLSIFLFFATPLTNTFIRTAEVEADLFGLNVARQPDGFAATAMQLAEYRKIQPGPLEEALFFDHPSGATRVRTAMQWKKEQPAREQSGR